MFLDVLFILAGCYQRDEFGIPPSFKAEENFSIQLILRNF